MPDSTEDGSVVHDKCTKERSKLCCNGLARDRAWQARCCKSKRSILQDQKGLGEPLLAAAEAREGGGEPDPEQGPDKLATHPSLASSGSSSSNWGRSASLTSEDSLKTRETADVGSVSGGASHYRPNNDVILRLEYLTARQTRTILLALWATTTLGWALLLALFGFKFTDRHPLSSNRIQILNAVFAAACLTVLSVLLFVFCARVLRTWRLKRRWTWRRRRFATMAFLELLIQWVGCALWLAPNALMLSRPCEWFSMLIPWTSFGRWTCFSLVFLIFLVHAHMTTVWDRGPGHREDSIVMDGPLYLHWPAFALWVVLEGCIVTHTVYYVTHGGSVASRDKAVRVPPGTEGDCRLWDYDCSVSGTQQALIVVTCLICFLFFAVYLLVIYRAKALLLARPYSDFKMGNLAVRLHTRLRTNVVIFFIFCIALLWFVRSNSCRSYIDTWAGGMLPLQLVATAVSVAYAFFAMPRCPFAPLPVLSVWLQEYCWTMCQKKRRLLARNEGRAADCTIHREPLFCLQEAISLLYFAALVYDYEEIPDSTLSLETAMDAFKCTDSELFWEKRHDTKLLLAWSEDTIVISFRGTASLTNALADLQAWQEVHPPARGNWWRRPRVHSGFLKSWRAGGLDRRVTARVLELQQAALAKGRCLTIYVTGHSLGAAIGTLCCYDLAKACQAASEAAARPPPLIICYTFGAPRVGSHSFAEELGELCPNTFHVINDLDLVCKSPKCVVMYKRHGQRTLIDANGDMLVRPSFVEQSVRARGASAAHHLLGSYRRSLLAVILAQVSRKRVAGGGEGVLKLVRESHLAQELVKSESGLGPGDLARMHRWGPATALTIAAKINPQLVLPGSRPTMAQRLADAPGRGLASLRASLPPLPGQRGSRHSGRRSPARSPAGPSLAQRLSAVSPPADANGSGPGADPGSGHPLGGSSQPLGGSSSSSSSSGRSVAAPPPPPPLHSVQEEGVSRPPGDPGRDTGAPSSAPLGGAGAHDEVGDKTPAASDGPVLLPGASEAQRTASHGEGGGVGARTRAGSGVGP